MIFNINKYVSYVLLNTNHKSCIFNTLLKINITRMNI